MADFKQAILDNLKAMRKIEMDNKQRFKVIAYSKAIKSIEDVKGPISNMEILAKAPHIGEGIRKKILEIMETGALAAAAPVIQNVADEKAVELLQEVMNIGPVKARDLVYNHGIKTIEALKASAASLLNEKQLAGLKHYEDFKKRIPRAELDKHNAFIKAVIDDVNSKALAAGDNDPITFEIAGSYRRGAKTSGDIDVLISCDSCSKAIAQIVHALTAKKYIVETFANGDGKFMGGCKLPRHRTVRRLDIVFLPKEKFAFALLYFTGSQLFNINMRKKALELGYSLSEHGLKHATGPNKGQFVSSKRMFHTEKDVFDFLEMPYVAPSDRNV